jgi:hypothetical protein
MTKMAVTFLAVHSSDVIQEYFRIRPEPNTAAAEIPPAAGSCRKYEREQAAPAKFFVVLLLGLSAGMM